MCRSIVGIQTAVAEIRRGKKKKKEKPQGKNIMTCPITYRAAIANYRMKLEMWAIVQRDGRPAEYRWRPLFNAAKFG